MADDSAALGKLEFYDHNIPCLAACPVHTNAGMYVAAIEAIVMSRNTATSRRALDLASTASIDRGYGQLPGCRPSPRWLCTSIGLGSWT